MITEAEKSHNLLSASWGPRRASDEIQYESKGLRTRGMDGVIPGSQSEVRRLILCSSSWVKSKFSLSLPFCFIQAFRGLDYVSLYWGGHLLYSVETQVMISSGNTLTDTPASCLTKYLGTCMAQLS